MDTKMLKAYTGAMYDFQAVKNEFFNRTRAKIEDGADKDFNKFGERLKNNEKVMARIVKKQLSEYPIFHEFFDPIKGLGTYMAAAIMSEIGDIKRFATVSRLWAYAGLHVIDGKAVKRERGKKSNWNSHLKTKLHVAVDCMIKLNFDEDKKPLRYRKFYDDYKCRMENRAGCHLTKEEHCKKSHRTVENQSVDASHLTRENQSHTAKPSVTWLPNGCTKGHTHNMAMRYVKKMLLQDLFLAWWGLEGGAPTAPYAEAVLGRKHGEYPKPDFLRK